MPRNIDYYFSLHSPWAYIGHIPFMEIVRSHNVKVTCKPISLTNVFAETGGLPVAKRHPARLRYRILELQRWREKRGLKFNLHPKFWPLNVETADRFVVALAAVGDDPDPFLRRAFAAIWEEEQNLADDKTLIAHAGGPLKALRFLVNELVRYPACEPLRPGELVTTGTLTEAMPAVGGQTWSTRLTGIDVQGLRLRFR